MSMISAGPSGVASSSVPGVVGVVGVSVSVPGVVGVVASGVVGAEQGL